MSVGEVTWKEEDERLPAGIYRGVIGHPTIKDDNGREQWGYPIAVESGEKVFMNFSVKWPENEKAQRVSRSMWKAFKRKAGCPDATKAEEVAGHNIRFELSYNEEWPRFKYLDWGDDNTGDIPF